MSKAFVQLLDLDAAAMQSALSAIAPTCRVELALLGRTSVAFHIRAYERVKCLVIRRKNYARTSPDELLRLARNALADLRRDARGSQCALSNSR